MSFAARANFDWQLRTRSLALGAKTRLMAIVNLTPDSFSGDGTGSSPPIGIAAAIAAVDGGADIVDLGAESTRPNAQAVSAEEEQARLLPVLQDLLRERPNAIVSVDTYHASTARAAAALGAEIINDVSGLLWDMDMAATVAETACGLVLMHTRGHSREWRDQPRLPKHEVVTLVRDELRARLKGALTARIPEEKIVLDPGFGFGKVSHENLPLLAGLTELAALGRPLLIGLSRKGFLGELIKPVALDADAPPAEARRSATLAANVVAAMNGAHVLRVHDLEETRKAIAVVDAVIGTREL